MQEIVSEEDFQKDVLQSDLPVWVDFWAQWCGPCLAAAPVLEELAGEYSGRVNFVKLNVDQNGPIASKYGIAAIPTMLVFKGGQPVKQLVGYRPKKQLKKVLEDILIE